MMARSSGPETAGAQRSLGGSMLARRNSEALRQGLEELVTDGTVGQRLPSERDLASTYGVARMTVRAALGRLERRGLIRRMQGAGTYIAEPRFAQPPLLTSFSEDMRVRGIEPGSQLLLQTLAPADERVAKHLGMVVDDPVVVIERVRTGDSEPIAIERAHLPAHRFPGLEGIDVASASLYDVLAEHYGCRLRSCEQRITAEPADAHAANLLSVDKSSSLLRIERVTRDVDGNPVEHVRSMYRGDRYELHTEHLRIPHV